MTGRVNIELAKLLKQKGWDINTYSHCWVKTLDGEIFITKIKNQFPNMIDVNNI